MLSQLLHKANLPYETPKFLMNTHFHPLCELSRFIFYYQSGVTIPLPAQANLIPAKGRATYVPSLEN